MLLSKISSRGLLNVKTNPSTFLTPRLPTRDSRLPTPDSRLETPDFLDSRPARLLQSLSNACQRPSQVCCLFYYAGRLPGGPGDCSKCRLDPSQLARSCGARFRHHLFSL